MVLSDKKQGESQESCVSFLMRNPWTSSLIEILFSLVISNFAIFVSVFVYRLIQDPTGPETPLFELFIDTLQKNIKPTEIIVYILGLIAPAMWIMVKNFTHWRHPAFLISLCGAQIVVVGSTTIIFAFSLANILTNKPFATGWAWGCLALALIVWYGTLVYEKAVLNVEGQYIPQPKPGSSSGDGILNDLMGGK